MNLKSLSDAELLKKTDTVVKLEREATADVIKHFQEIYDRRLYLPKYPSFFEMVIQEYRYCNGSAQLRINAMKLIKDVPSVEAKLESGEMSLTVAANIQTFLRKEKQNDRAYSQNAKIELIETCTNKSVSEVQREFARRDPEIDQPDVVRFMASDRVRVEYSQSLKIEEKYQQIKAIWSHVDPNMSREELHDRCYEVVLDQIDPVRKAERAMKRQARKSLHVDEVRAALDQSELHKNEVNSAVPDSTADRDKVAETASNLSLHLDKVKKRFVKAEDAHQVWLKNDGVGCEFVDTDTGRICGSHFQLQRDHVTEFSRGGSNQAENLQVLCAKHNRFRWRQRAGALVRCPQLAYG